MSTPANTPGEAPLTAEPPSTAEPPLTADRRSRRELARTAALVVLAVLITLFAVFNVDEVKVHYIFGTGKAPLIIVIVVSALVGAVLTRFAERRVGKRRRRD
jgi:uncharacterized integral membrane protein